MRHAYAFTVAALLAACASQVKPAVPPPPPVLVAPPAPIAPDPLLVVLDFCANHGGDPETIDIALTARRLHDRITAVVAASVVVHNLASEGVPIPAAVLIAIGDAWKVDGR